MGEINKSIFEYHDLIEAIVAAVEARDINTQYHSERVSNMTEAICFRMGLKRETTELFHIAADLHDIGKIGVSDKVLLKPDKLDKDEWVEMQSHTIIGEYILKKVERFDEISEIVGHHHERWDGKGYPDKLSGENIPLGSRIIAVADSIDAMLSDRAYRKGMTSEECRKEVERNVGKMYDPEIAEIALNNWEYILNTRQVQSDIPMCISKLSASN